MVPVVQGTSIVDLLLHDLVKVVVVRVKEVLTKVNEDIQKVVVLV